ncbi:DUF881 domain-containing protein [Tepidibacillus marianensis]|uniref:DUF881 domain-containing protein n=1 Tax=Tepidibacillus marianensis TaxID=3131995 RepID=UPI0030CDBD18
MFHLKRKIPLAITFISLTIGFMISIQYHSTQELFTLHSRDITEIRSDLSKEMERKDALLKDLEKKQKLLSQYKNKSVNQEATDIMQEELNKSEMVAGLVPVKGKGLTVTIQSNGGSNSNQGIENMVIDDDLRTLVNELFANGAQAISINGQRLIANTAIRNVGDQIQVNNHFIHFPYQLDVIGDQEMLKAGLQVAGLPDYFKLLNKQLVIEGQDSIEVPAYTGDYHPKYMKPVKAGEK